MKYVYRIEDTKDAPMLGAASAQGTGEQTSGSQPCQSKYSPVEKLPFSQRKISYH